MIEGRDLSDTKFQINSLDGLRGMAFFLVFLSHTSNAGTYLLPFANFSGIGKHGVFLFFVLSSFLLTLPFIKKREDAMNKGFLLNYAFRRFFRIYPLYFLYLLLGLVTSLTLWKILDLAKPFGIPFTLSAQDFFEHLILVQGKGVTWSIAVEFRYYFVLPVLALVYSVFFKNKLLPSIILTVILIIIGQYFWPPLSGSGSIQDEPRLGRYLPIFFMGSLLAVIFYRWQESTLSKNKKVILAIELLGFSAIFVLIYMIPSVSRIFLGNEMPMDYYHHHYVLFGLLWSIVLFSCLSGIGVLRNFFENRFLRYLGFISFSAYLFHGIILGAFNKLGADIPMKGWIELVLTIAVSHISWVLIEKPTSKIRLVKQ
jgi:peptidoglycan/LPS O-acetylase OafA/YrhL